MKTKTAKHRIKQDIISFCYRGLDASTLFKEASRKLRQVVPFDADHWLITDPETLLPTTIVSDYFPSALSIRIAENELLEDDFNKLFQIARTKPHVLVLGDAVEGRPEQSRRYRDIMAPLGWTHELRAALTAGGSCWGYLCLHRNQGQPDFSKQEADFISQIGPHLGEGIRNALIIPMDSADKGTDVPGMIILDGRMSPELITPSATYLLNELGGGWRGPGNPLPEVVYTVATKARALNRAGSSNGYGMAQARVRTTSGRWLVFHSSRLDSYDQNKERTAVMVELAQPSHIIPFVIESYELSKREQQVLFMIVRGASTEEIALQLFISPYTVQEHLKSIFTKTGIRSRRELVGRLFFDYYFPQLKAQTLH